MNCQMLSAKIEVEKTGRDSNYSLFKFKNNDVRVAKIDGVCYFCGKDVCITIGASNHRDSLSRLDEDEKRCVGLPDAIGRDRETIFVTESGLYSLILRSRKPEAKDFKRWVTHEVLPALRKHGVYATDPAIAAIQKDPSIIQRMLADSEASKEAVRRAELERDQKQYQLDNFRALHFMDDEHERVNHLVEVASNVNAQHLDHLNICYVRVLKETITIDGVEYIIFKFGKSSHIIARLKNHKTQYKNSRLAQLFVTANDCDTESAFRDYLRAHKLLLPGDTRTADGKKHSELFITRADHNIYRVINAFQAICTQRFPITVCESKMNEQTKEIARLKGELATYTAKCATLEARCLELEKQTASDAAILTTIREAFERQTKPVAPTIIINNAPNLIQSESSTSSIEYKQEDAPPTPARPVAPAPPTPAPDTTRAVPEVRAISIEERAAEIKRIVAFKPKPETHRVCATCDDVVAVSEFGKWQNGALRYECTACFSKRAALVVDMDKPTFVCITCARIHNTSDARKDAPTAKQCTECKRQYLRHRTRANAFDLYVKQWRRNRLHAIGARACTTCSKVRDLDQFGKHTGGPLGYKTSCVVCRRAEYRAAADKAGRKPRKNRAPSAAYA